MKKIVVSVFVFAFLLVGMATNSHAETKMPMFYDSAKENQQVFGYFMLDLYQWEIMDAIRNHYKTVEVRGYQTPWWMKHNLVSIVSQEKGNGFLDGRHAFMLKITLLPTTKEGKVLGTDTIYLAVSPGPVYKEYATKDFKRVELVKYDHKNPPKNGPTTRSIHSEN